MGVNNEEITMIDLLDKVFSNVNNWLTFAEAKNGALIALNIGIIAAIVSSTDFFGKNILTYIGVFCVFLSTMVALVSFVPKTGKEREQAVVFNAKDNLLFYKDISKYNAEDYLDALYKKYYGMEKQRNEMKQLEIDYCQEITYNSYITDLKNVKFRTALEIDLLTVGIIILMILVA